MLYLKNHCSLMFFVLVLILATNSLFAQNTNASPTKAPPFKDLLENLPPDPIPSANIGDATNSNRKIPPLDGVELDDSTKKAYLGALRSYYEYHQSGLEHRKGVFAWQLLSSKIIFFTVILLVLCGVCFSGIQFYIALRMSSAVTTPLRKGKEPAKSQKKDFVETEKNPVQGVAPEIINKIVTEEVAKGQNAVNIESMAVSSPLGEQLATEIEASLEGVRISSPVLGVIILTLSFLFFYLYLKYVYPINEIF